MPQLEYTATVHTSFERTASWTDIMAKSKRLLQSGQVHMLRNGFNYIIGHVIGDHGEYDTEISRDDPNSRAITGWQCSCPWDTYAWQRTRKWKKYEGRPCAHTLALYWKALSTPLDEQLTPEQAEQMGTGQKMTPDAPAVPEHPPGHEPGGPEAPEHLPRSFGPEGDIIQGDQQQMNMPPDALGHPPGPAQAPMAPPPSQGPAPPGILPPFQPPPEPIPYAGPGTTPGGGESPPGAISIPGAKPVTPFNPLQNPGTYSKVAGLIPYAQLPGRGDPGLEGELDGEGIDPATTLWQRMTVPLDKVSYDTSDWALDPEAHALGDFDTGEPIAVFPENGYYQLLDGRHRSEQAQQEGATTIAAFVLVEGSDWEGQVHRFSKVAAGGMWDTPGPEGPLITWRRQYATGQITLEQYEALMGPYVEQLEAQGKPINWELVRTSAQFNAPEPVRAKKPLMGLAEGPVPGQYGDGEYREIPAGSPGEVRHQDATTGWIECAFDLNNSGPNEPYRITVFVEPGDIESAGDLTPSDPAIRRHTKVAADPYSGPLSAQMWHGSSKGAMGDVRPGLYLTEHRPEADAYGDVGEYFDPEDRGAVVPMSVNLRNPAHYWGHHSNNPGLPNWSEEARDSLAARGHDGAVIHFPATTDDPSDPRPSHRWAYIADPAAVTPSA